jgi:hypothetical protein
MALLICSSEVVALLSLLNCTYLACLTACCFTLPMGLRRLWVTRRARLTSAAMRRIYLAEGWTLIGTAVTLFALVLFAMVVTNICFNSGEFSHGICLPDRFDAFIAGGIVLVGVFFVPAMLSMVLRMCYEIRQFRATRPR